MVLSEPREGGGWVVRAYVNPLAPFIWLGAVIMALGGFIAATDRRYRSKVPAPVRDNAASPPNPEPKLREA